MKKLVRAAAVIIFAVGLAFFAYPLGLKLSYAISTEKAIDGFNELRGEAEKNEGEAEPYAALHIAMHEYNERLFSCGQSGLIDQLSYETPDFHVSDYGVDSDILGYITIPSISVKLPVYNGASEANMAKGAAYLAHTSLPVGGENTNCVIAGHTRYKGIYMFRRITELQTGDEIQLTNLWETLTYRVVETRIIEPSDSSCIYIRQGCELLTLSTCYPFPATTHRYLVFAERVEV